ncbi:3-phosphoshikimate 1-carboxyvinyltransferase [Auraticoccus sp. F435]|uniref:3-phosphoshikimate 1-carboxyvinyltransferase n=1 Tax=Auraticoccus cholistanensis TaxID=2656650 RepID=A0A6A9V0R3_9ACTN|nr:3-phosphoshikimate 1-carboxyvinyltransferase [Auraticoccus cholistanensis]MVA76079.1 3-phosphoshikimate 1-carboxyvinyltransferase [Auraticoccus cholistanensis]
MDDPAAQLRRETGTTPAAPRRAAGAWPAPRAEERVHAVVSVPGSKSETNRALLLAAIADGPSTITGGLDARDTQLMRDALRVLGVQIDDDGPTWRVTPAPPGFEMRGTIDCGLAGTVMRFVPPLAAATAGQVLVDGDEQAYARPMRPLIDALIDIGARIGEDVTGLPFTITGRPDLPGGPVVVDASSSSQYVSALLLVGPRLPLGIDIRHVGATLPSLPHIAMTVSMLRERGVEVDDSTPHRWVVRPGPVAARDVTVEPDLSNAAPFLAAAAITGGRVTVTGWPRETDQPGALLPGLLTDLGAEVELGAEGLTVTGTGHLRAIDVDLSAASELTPVVAAVCALAPGTSHIRGVAHIRGHETDRLAALEAELERLGSHVDQTADGLTIHPRLLHGGTFRTYADHRMAHAGALLGLIVDDVTLDDIACTAKTMPQFPELWLDMLHQSDEWLAAQVRPGADGPGGS